MSHKENPENTGKNGVSGELVADPVAVETKTERIEPDLQAVIDAWSDLPEALRQGILAMVRTAGSSAAGAG
jgi:hypothetical protein